MHYSNRYKLEYKSSVKLAKNEVLKMAHVLKFQSCTFGNDHTHLFLEQSRPKFLTNEFDNVKFRFEPRTVLGESLHDPVTRLETNLFQFGYFGILGKIICHVLILDRNIYII